MFSRLFVAGFARLYELGEFPLFRHLAFIPIATPDTFHSWATLFFEIQKSCHWQ